MDPRALTELIPDWKARGAPLNQAVTADEVLFLTPTGVAPRRRRWLVPDCFHNDGNYVISLGAVTRWLAEQAEALGVEIFRRLCRRRSAVRRRRRACAASPPATSASARTASRPTDFQLGMELLGKYTVFAEGARGHLGQQLIARFDARRRPRPAELRARASRSCGRSTRPGASPAWSSTPPAGRWTSTPTAAASCTTWRATRSTLGFVTGPRLPEPLAQPVRGDAALEDASGDPRPHRRRQAHRLRRARHHRRRRC